MKTPASSLSEPGKVDIKTWPAKLNQSEEPIIVMKQALSFYFALVLFIQSPGILMGQNSQLDATAKLMKELTEAHGPTGSE